MTAAPVADAAVPGSFVRITTRKPEEIERVNFQIKIIISIILIKVIIINFSYHVDRPYTLHIVSDHQPL